MDNNFDLLLSPLQVGNLRLKNRMIMCPMSAHMAPFAGDVTEREILFYEERAKGGVALITLGATFVDPLGSFGNGQLGLWKDSQVPGLRRLVEAIQRHGCLASIQIHHSGRQTSPELCGGQPVAPSPVSLPNSSLIPRELSLVEIRTLVEAYGQTARRAKLAGFDAVELHFAHGYLPCQFLSRLSNHRTDEYGGDWEGRSRFMREIVLRVREAVGEGFTISAKITGEEFTEGGLTLEDGKRVARMLEQLGVSYISVSSGYYPYFRVVPNMTYPIALNVGLAEEIKSVVKIPVMTQGRIHDPDLAEDLLAAGRIDLVGLGRPLISDAYFPAKVSERQVNDIVPCLSCNKGCHDRFRVDRSMACLMNYWAGREGSDPITKAELPKRVVVIGAGPAGLEAARVATLRGHSVVVLEKSSRIGGRIIDATVPPMKEGYVRLLDYYDHVIRKLGIEVKLNTEATREAVSALSPDVVVMATGSKTVFPLIPGLSDVGHLAEDVLLGGGLPAGKTVVIGAGAVGCETAHYLAVTGHEVTLIEMSGVLGRGLAR
jgi:2,4-dienoyl-CoA reductase-like NADH-dependent reductase (Old Yellow Enzyme family)